MSALEREWAHWDGEAGHHRVEVRGHTLYRYWAGEDSPRWGTLGHCTGTLGHWDTVS